MDISTLANAGIALVYIVLISGIIYAIKCRNDDLEK